MANNDCDGSIDEADCTDANLTAGVCVGSVKVCQGAAVGKANYNALEGYEALGKQDGGQRCDGDIDELTALLRSSKW